MPHPNSKHLCDICQHEHACRYAGRYGKMSECIYYEPYPTPEPEQKKPVIDLIKQVSEMDSKNGKLQSNFVIEECAELIAEMANTYREGKANTDRIIDEACDVLTTVFVLLYSLGVSREYVRNRIEYKCRRALSKENKNG